MDFNLLLNCAAFAKSIVYVNTSTFVERLMVLTVRNRLVCALFSICFALCSCIEYD